MATGTAALAVALLFAVPLYAQPLEPAIGPAVTPAVLTSCAVGTHPMGVAYDPVTHNMYVANYISSNISVVAAPCTVVATIPLPTYAAPIEVAFDPQNNYIYVTDALLSQVYVISGTTVIATLNGGHFNGAGPITYDPGEGAMIVGNLGWSNITFVFGTAVGGAIPVGIEPVGIAYDPFYNTLLVANQGSLNVTVISSATYPFSATHTNVFLNVVPGDIRYDPASSSDYVTSVPYVSALKGNVTEMTGLGGILATVPLAGYPIQEAFSQAKLAVYVCQLAPSVVWELSGATVVKKVVIGLGSKPDGMAYDESTNMMYVAGSGTDRLYAIP
jgi:DNA-binding beta-propeller fold protein YncE